MEINSVLWVIGNLMVFLVFVSSLLFSVIYPLVFKFEETTAGKMIWLAIFSVVGFGLTTFIGIFIDGRVAWTVMPDDIAWWRPIFRLIVFGFIGYTFVSLVVLLLVRRFRPRALRVAPEVTQALAADISTAYLQISGTGTGSVSPQAQQVAMLLTEKGWTRAGLEPDPGTLNVHPRDLRGSRN